MDTSEAIDIFSALAQPTRLDAFRLLVRHEPLGLAAGELARRLDVPHNTLSSHLSILARTGLVRAERQSRSVIYRADPEQARAIASFLLENCCGGDADSCPPLDIRDRPPPGDPA
ncbi:metalloregulator ArsR/SmtB family transcription factor [Aurantimonas sp. MSK8Z-1]|uniref:ArsR/SmtB family transcription factor n=1 Tax=Mangrovibrevibacter kandeliae TaxID=2968473 RepID=UPI0021176D5B|nr:metalloregulator ArsR/SmtB family transcription factor [Aurantimonas sp. MSK8Z-1]MCW4113371.1 metalloregulator ArsR/SmtB family transcription factor [Aurantimonas sp. MSK8Z-1]